MALCLALAALFAGARADEPKGVRVERAKAEPTTTQRLPLDNLSETVPAQPSERHPLVPAMDMAVKAYQYAQDHVHDFTCVLIKRERIDGNLLDPQIVQTRVRADWADAGRRAQPYSVFLNFLSPPLVRGRKVLFIEGRNDNKMLERNGGKLFNYMTFKLDPESEAAMRQTLVPITRMGFANVTELLISLIQQDMRRDPLALNTKVSFYRNAKVNDRVCTRIMVTHPQPDPILEFAEGNVFVDDELHVPIRIEAAAWPSQMGESKPPLFEYTLTQLQLNVGLTDADFQVSLLDGSR
jgi:hypothetical protein